MVASVTGLRNISAGGTIADSNDPSGSVTANIFHYATNHTEAEIETDGYFDALYPYFNKGALDIIIVSGDRDGAPVGLMYLVTRTAGDIALTAIKGTG